MIVLLRRNNLHYSEHFISCVMVGVGGPALGILYIPFVLVRVFTFVSEGKPLATVVR